MNLCSVCNEDVQSSGYKTYGCEICPAWIHAKCAFPNASDNDLKILYKFNSGFDVKCHSCKQDSKQKHAKILLIEVQEQLTEILSVDKTF